MNILDLVCFCAFSGNVLVAFSHLPKGEGRSVKMEFSSSVGVISGHIKKVKREVRGMCSALI